MTEFLAGLAALFGAKTPYVVSGVSGSLLALLFTPGLTLRMALMIVAAGMGCSAYIGPALAEWVFDQPSASMVSAAGFLSGFLGLVLLSGLMVLGRRWQRNPTVPHITTNKPGEGDDDA